jgi:hypothetical protein
LMTLLASQTRFLLTFDVTIRRLLIMRN